MPRIFLSTSLSSGKLDADGQVQPEVKARIESVLGTLRGVGHQVFCAVEQMDWTVGHNPPETKTKEVLAELEAAETFVALLGDIISAGVQMETGYALAMQKRVLLAAPAGTVLPYATQGIVNLGLAAVYYYEGTDDLAEALAVACGSEPGARPAFSGLSGAPQGRGIQATGLAAGGIKPAGPAGAYGRVPPALASRGQLAPPPSGSVSPVADLAEQIKGLSDDEADALLENYLADGTRRPPAPSA